MAAYDYSTFTPNCEPRYNKPFVVRGTFNAPYIADQEGAALASGDTVAIAVIPDNALILAGYYKITTGEGASETVDVGYSAGGTDNLSNLDVQTAGNWTIMSNPNFDADDFDETSAATTVYVKLDAAVNSAVLDVMYLCVLNNDFIANAY